MSEIRNEQPELQNPYELITRRTNVTNRRFACLLIATRLREDARQQEELTNLCAIARDVAWKTNYTTVGAKDLRDDWDGIAHLCIAKEAQKESDLDIPGVILRANENGFAYIWHALSRDFKNAKEAYYNQRKNEPYAAEWSAQYRGDPDASEQTAQQLEQAAKGLPNHPAVIVRCLADKYREGLTEETQTQIRMSIVRKAAERSGLSIKQVQRHLESLRNPRTSEFALPKTIMRTAAQQAEDRQDHPNPIVSAELKEEIARQLETQFQPHAFYKLLDDKDWTIAHSIPIPGLPQEEAGG
jgi:multidrug efflux pump subunit AcrB